MAGQNRCQICVLPQSLGSVHFNSKSTCKYCLEFKDNARSAEHHIDTARKLDTEIEHIRQRGQGRPYDVLIGLSGGRDSSYLAHLLAHKYKLRMLAVYYRTPFTQDRTDSNVRRIAQHLDIPLVEMSVSQKSHTEAAKSFFLKWYKNPRPEYAALCCAGCKLLHHEVFQVARQQNIKSIIFGGNPLENVPFLPTGLNSIEDSNYNNFGVQFRRMTKIFRKGLGIVLQCPPRLFPLSIKASLLYLPPHTPYLRCRYPDIHNFDYFHLAPWEESDCVETIQKELGWQPNPDTAETWKTDCDFASLKNYMFYKMYGATYNDALYSNLIRNGQITRDEAISRIRAGAGFSIESIHRAMQTMGLPIEMIDFKTIEKAREV